MGFHSTVKNTVKDFCDAVDSASSTLPDAKVGREKPLVELWGARSICCLLLGGVVFAMTSVAPLFSRTTIFETPTALTLEYGEYMLEGSLYDGGGLLAKASVGVNRYVNLGVEEYVDNLIGKSKPRWEIPHVMGKFRLTPFGDEKVNLAIGYDTLYNGAFRPFDRVSYGPYVVVTVGFPKHVFLQSPHFFSFGLRMPVFYDIAEPDLFVSLHLRLLPFFEIASEISNIHFGKQYNYYFINNNLLIFKIGDAFTLDTVFQLAGKIDPSKENNIKMEWAIGMKLSFKSFF